MNQFIRTSMLLGYKKMEKIKKSTIAIFGLGGVGSYVVESLARVGIENLILIDNDIIDETNINRQIFALHSTVGSDKVVAAKNRVLDINPKAKITIYKLFYSKKSNQSIIKFCDYVVDAIDTISSKLDLIEECKKNNIPIISCMGTGNKLNPNLFEISDIFSTSICPMCRIMRKELKKRKISSLKVIYSKEKPIKSFDLSCDTNKNKMPIGSISFVPATAGLIIASEIIKDIVFN